MMTTTLTDFVAFMIGATTQLPALASFCIWAAFAIAAVFIFSITFFPACLVLDQYRQATGRYDICCCCGSGVGHPESVYSFPETDPRLHPASSSGKAIENPAEGDPPAAARAGSASRTSADADAKDLPAVAASAPKAGTGAKSSHPTHPEDGEPDNSMQQEVPVEEYVSPAPGVPKQGYCGPGAARYILYTYYAQNLLSLPGKIITFFVFTLLAAMAAWQVTGLKQEFRSEWFVPSDSPLQEWYDILNEYFTDSGGPISAYARSVRVFEDFAVVPALCEGLRTNEFVSESQPVICWGDSFRTDRADLFADGVTKADFVAGFRAWTTGQGARYGQDIIYDPETNEDVISITRVTAFYRAFTSSQEEIDAMDTTRAGIEEAAVGAGFTGTAFAFSFAFFDAEQYKVVQQEILQNLGLAVAAVAVIVLIVVAHPLMMVYLTLMVALVLLNILGYLVPWGVTLDGVVSVNLVLAIGIAVDYSLHLGESFMHKHGTTEHRAALALSDMGVAVINGATSTLLAVVVLSASQSYIFVVFFKCFFLSVVLGIGHGMILLPVVLATVGPGPHPHFDDSESIDGVQSGNLAAHKAHLKEIEMAEAGSANSSHDEKSVAPSGPAAQVA